jgi:hypothetical protein
MTRVDPHLGAHGVEVEPRVDQRAIEVEDQATNRPAAVSGSQFSD